MRKAELVCKRPFGLGKDPFRPARLKESFLGQGEEEAGEPLRDEDASVE